MATSQNGWPALGSYSDRLLHSWDIPAKSGHSRILLRNGSAGFLLSHFLLWFAEQVEPMSGGVLDDWGYAYRPVRGSESGLSNHASGTAADINATQHPLGVSGTFSNKEIDKIHKRLAVYKGALRWGGDYTGRIDSMHIEIDCGLPHAERVAKGLLKSPRGLRILMANAGQKHVILS